MRNPSGSDHPRWKGGRGTDGRYISILLPNGRRRHEHRLIAERVLGRPLTRSECVHHIDGNGLNNAPSNLIIMDRSYHRWLHAALLKRSPDLLRAHYRHHTRKLKAAWARLTPKARAARLRGIRASRDIAGELRQTWAKRSPEERTAIATRAWATRRQRTRRLS
jgi:hypothetical protein